MTADVKPSKPSFTLSKSNKIYFLIIIIVVATVHTWMVMQAVSAGAASQEVIAQKTGELIFSIMLRFLFIPGFFAYIVWWARSKKEKAGTTIFNIAVTIMLILQFLSLGSNSAI